MIGSRLKYSMIMVLFLSAETWAVELVTAEIMIDITIETTISRISINQIGRGYLLRDPVRFEARPDHASPFHARSVAEFDPPVESGMLANLYNVLGRRIRILENYTRPPGRYQVEWDGMTEFGQPAVSGVYFFVLLTDDNYAIRKMLLLK